MQPFEVTVLDKRRTLTEKLVSLLRCSLHNNPIPELFKLRFATLMISISLFCMTLILTPIYNVKSSKQI